MMFRLLAAASLAAALPAAGCTITFGDDDDCTYADDGYFDDSLRNPETGVCESYGGGGGGGCYDTLPAAEDQAAPFPDWASCNSGCEGLDEATCAAADTCRGAYYESCPDCEDLSPPTFYECWGVAPSGPLPPDVDCYALDAYGCSQRSDCQAVYTDGWLGGDPTTGVGAPDAAEWAGLSFLYCQPEANIACGEDVCEPGERCEETCYPQDCDCAPDAEACECPLYCEQVCVPDYTGVCTGVDCGEGFHCVEYCDGGGMKDGEAFDPAQGCYPACEPDSGECGGLICEPGQLCGEECVEFCEGGADGDIGCWTECYPTCIDQGQTCDDGSECPEGSHCSTSCLPCEPGANAEMCGCVTTCEPNLNGCEAALCEPGTHCEQVCEPCGPNELCELDQACRIECVPDQGHDPGECVGEVACDALPPACPDGTVPGIADLCWTGFCIPVEACAPVEPGQCFGEVDFDQVLPDCPEGTTPGILDGRYTGFCIPLWACEGEQSCEAFTTLEGCLSAADLACAPTFVGTDCTCDAAGNCSCANLEFDACVSTSEDCLPTPCAAPPDGCDYVGGGCIDGAYTCGVLVCADGQP